MRSAAALFLCACATHTVTVLAPVSDVPLDTPVVAAVTPGKVEELESGTHLRQIRKRLAATDLVAVEATSGDKFGSISVTRGAEYDVVTALGILAMAGGVIGSWVGAAACNAANTVGVAFDCYFYGLIGTAASVVVAIPVMAIGVHGDLKIVSLAPNGVTLAF